MEESIQRAYLVGLRLLGRRALSVQELTLRLRRRGMGAEAVEAAVSRLAAEGALDDRAYARAYVHDRLLFHPVGRRALRNELVRRGVSADIVKEMLAEFDATREEALVRELLRRRMPRSPEEVRRTQARLVRRGFPLETIRKALRAEGAAADLAGDEPEG